jgi:hypothetical protein
MLSDAELLAIQFQTTFVFEPSGRISALNDPDRSPAPRFALFGCASGNNYGIRADVTDGVATQLMDCAALEPPFVERSGTPEHLDRYIELLSREALISKRRLEITYILPNDIGYQQGVRLICSDTVEGQRLGTTLAKQGLPTGLAKMGFVGDFWAPWCVALHHGETASVAFAARLSETGRALDWLPRRG